MQIKLFSINKNKIYTNNGIEYLTKYLRITLPDDIIKAYFFCNDEIEKIYDEIDLDTDIYGFSVFSTNYTICKDVSEAIKRKKSEAIVIFGGQFVTLNYAEMIEDVPFVNYLILGDGEDTLKNIIIWHRNNVELINDEHVISRYDLHDKKAYINNDIDKAHSYDFYLGDTESNNRRKTHTLFTKSNVCAGSCSFCCSRKGIIKYRPVDSIIDEIFYVHDKFSIKDFWITDDDIFDADNDYNRRRLDDLFSRISNIKINIGISSFAKPKSVCNPLNLSLLKKMSSAGMHHIFLGIDGANRDDIKLYHKQSTLEQGKSALRILNDVGIGTRFGIIFLNPYTTLKIMEDSFNFLKDVHSTNYYHYGGLKVQLLKGTQLYNKVKEDNLFRNNFSFLNNDSYHFLNPEIYPVLDILNVLIPRLNSIKYQFNIFKYKYYQAFHLNEYAKTFDDIYKKYEFIEFNFLTDYFYRLYVEHDYEFCFSKMEKFVNEMEHREKIYKPWISKLDSMIFEA